MAWACSSVTMARRLIGEADMASDPARQSTIDAAPAAMPGDGAWQVLLVLDKVNGHWQATARGLRAESRPTRRRWWRFDAQLGLLAEATQEGA